MLFWSYRYYDAYFGLPIVADRAILVPTAEEDPLIHVDVLERYFALPRGLLYLTPEEQELVEMRLPPGKPSEIIGCGLDPVADAPDRSCLDALGLTDPFVLYLGRDRSQQRVRRAGAALLALRRRWTIHTAGDGGTFVDADPGPSVDPHARLRRARRARGVVVARARVDDAVAVREPEHGPARGVESRAAGVGERAMQGAARPGRARRRRALLRQRRRVLGGARLPAPPPRCGGRARPSGTRLCGSRVPVAHGDGKDRAACW